MPIQNIYLHEVTGKVVNILSKVKAVIVFQSSGKDERALVRYGKVKINGLDLPDDGSLADYLEEGSEVTFSCHSFDDSGCDRCGWFVTQISQQISKLFPHLGFNELSLKGICNASGTVSVLTKRMGVLSFQTDKDGDDNVFFLASKFYLYGNRVKVSLKDHPQLEEGITQLNFDAVPCNEQENEFGCQWFATVVWLGPKKPLMDYDTSDRHLQQKQQFEGFLSKIKTVAFNPRTMFVCGEGQIMSILNAEYGLAIGAVQPNRWQSILFHRSMCFLFKLNLSTHDLTQIFKEGDKIKFIAVPAPKKYIAQLIATQISVYTDPCIRVGSLM